MELIIWGVFIRELKNRFLCEVEIDGQTTLCYVPSSCHLSNFLDLYRKIVLLVPTKTANSRTPYALFAVPYKKSFIVLNTTMANRAVESSIGTRHFSQLGKRNIIIKEHSVDGYKCDLFIADTDTVIEVKSLISYSNNAVFPTVFSERSIIQLRKLQELLKIGKKACYCIVSLHPYTKEIVINQNTVFFTELEKCIDLGMQLCAFTTRLKNTSIILEHKIPVSYMTLP